MAMDVVLTLSHVSDPLGGLGDFRVKLSALSDFFGNIVSR